MNIDLGLLVDTKLEVGLLPRDALDNSSFWEQPPRCYPNFQARQVQQMLPLNNFMESPRNMSHLSRVGQVCSVRQGRGTEEKSRVSEFGMGVVSCGVVG